MNLILILIYCNILNFNPIKLNFYNTTHLQQIYFPTGKLYNIIVCAFNAEVDTYSVLLRR